MKMEFNKDLKNKKLHITKEFHATPELVWQAWTTPELLEQWWAPKPYKAITKTMNFKEGGYWHYYMLSPEGEKHWCRADYQSIKTHDHFTYQDAFCDEKGTPNTAHPSMHWKNTFQKKGIEVTKVIVEISFQKEDDIQKIIEMGFKEGFSMALENLDEYIRQQFKIRNELKQNKQVRVTTYLNFPGNTEEAFNFYKTVFKSKFSGKGMQRFGDIPQESGHPPIQESIKKMILHVELPILNGHILMATDAPKEMGFTLEQGNNMHICLEPESREETQRLFKELSHNGKITMPLEEMFFGALFGSCTDQFGVNWMLNYKL